MSKAVRRLVLPFCYIPPSGDVSFGKLSSDEIKSKILFLCAWEDHNGTKRLYTGEYNDGNIDDISQSTYSLFPAIETLFIEAQSPSSVIRTLDIYNKMPDKKGENNPVLSVIKTKLKELFVTNRTEPILSKGGEVRVYPLQVQFNPDYPRVANNFNQYVKKFAPSTNSYASHKHRSYTVAWFTKEEVNKLFPEAGSIVNDMLRAYDFSF